MVGLRGTAGEVYDMLHIRAEVATAAIDVEVRGVAPQSRYSHALGT